MATPTEKELNDSLDRIRADIASLTDSVKTLVPTAPASSLR
jgi:hypothetical protein